MGCGFDFRLGDFRRFDRSRFSHLGLARGALALGLFGRGLLGSGCFLGGGFRRRFSDDFGFGLDNLGLARSTLALGLFYRRFLDRFSRGFGRRGFSFRFRLRSRFGFGHFAAFCLVASFAVTGVFAARFAFIAIAATLAPATAATAALLGAALAIITVLALRHIGACFAFFSAVFAIGLAVTVLVTGFAFGAILTVATAATTAAATLLAATAILIALGADAAFAALARLALGLVFFLLVGVFFLGEFLVFVLVDDRIEARGLRGARSGARHVHLRAFVLALGHDFDADAVTLFDLDQIGALFVEQVDRRLGAGRQTDLGALALGRLVLDQTQRRKARRRSRTHQTRAVAMRTGAGGGFEYAGSQALAAHFHQAERADAPDLDARAIILERVLHRLFDLTDVGGILHVDEVDDDQTRHVAQAQLPGDFARRFEVGVQRGLLDIVFLGRATGVDVDRDQRLGRIDDQVAAGLQLDHRIIHCPQLVFRAIALEQRHGIGIGLNPPRVAGHQQLHEGLGRLVAFLALDHDFLDVAVVDVADRALDEVAVRMDQCRRNRGERLFADLVPHAGEVIEVALDLGLGAAHPGGADDQAHALGELEVRDHFLQPLAIAGRADLAADAAAARRIRHQHCVTAREAEIGGERRALVAAFFLDDLHQQHLTALDHVLDLVAATQRHALGAHFIDLLGAAAALVAALVALALPAATAAATATLFLAVLAGFLIAVVVVAGVLVRAAVFDGGNIVFVGGVDFLDAVFGKIFGQRFAAVVLGVVFVAGGDAFFLLLGA